MQGRASRSDGGTVMGSELYVYAVEEMFNCLWLVLFQRVRCVVNKLDKYEDFHVIAGSA
jgi:hypothetical protein